MSSVKMLVKSLQLILTLVIVSSNAESSGLHHPNLIVILVDGFRWDYTEIHKGSGLPGFDYLMSTGVRAKYLNPVFPPNSFPNWHTIVTGLYPETHGIVSNFMYDPTSKRKFNLYDLETIKDPDWWGDVEPLWVTTTKNNIDTALFYWSRCDVPWDGVLPRFCIPYDYEATKSHYFVKQLHQALDMIQGEDYSLMMLYTGGVDFQGHHYGPESPEVGAAVREVDAVLEGLWYALNTREMTNNTNVVILSDHGMARSAPDAIEFVDVIPCIDRQYLVSTTEYGSLMNILPAAGYAEQVVESIKSCAVVNEKVDVYLKEELHKQYHYRAHRLIHEIIVIPKPGFFILPLDELVAVPENAPLYVGDHGFDNTFGQAPSMRGILYATGPSFAKGIEAGVVEQVDVYGLLCRALQLSSCHPSNGTNKHIEAFFNTERSSVDLALGEINTIIFMLLLSLFLVSSFGVLWENSL